MTRTTETGIRREGHILSKIRKIDHLMMINGLSRGNLAVVEIPTSFSALLHTTKCTGQRSEVTEVHDDNENKTGNSNNTLRRSIDNQISIKSTCHGASACG